MALYTFIIQIDRAVFDILKPEYKWESIANYLGDPLQSWFNRASAAFNSPEKQLMKHTPLVLMARNVIYSSFSLTQIFLNEYNVKNPTI